MELTVKKTTPAILNGGPKSYTVAETTRVSRVLVSRDPDGFQLFF